MFDALVTAGIIISIALSSFAFGITVGQRRNR